jgi:hypothetical protein
VAGLHLAHARVVRILDERAGLTRLLVDVAGSEAIALSLHAFGPTPEPGAAVIVNTTAVDLGLGTGGAHLIVPGDPVRAPLDGHAMKLRYTPLQVALGTVEERGDEPSTLGGAPVVAIALHSALVPVALGVRAARPDARIAYVMTDAAALPLALSDTVAAAREAGLIDLTITAGQAFGGELEAVNVYGALCAAAARADVVVCGMGPGNLGTGSPLGTASLEVGQVINAVAALGGRPIVAPRISFADPRARHRGVSHHTLTALSVVALAPADVVLPSGPEEALTALRALLEPVCAARGHRVVEREVDPGCLAGAPLPLRSMGRAPEDDPLHFLAPVAAGLHAASVLA